MSLDIYSQEGWVSGVKQTSSTALITRDFQKQGDSVRFAMQIVLEKEDVKIQSKFNLSSRKKFRLGAAK